MYLYPEYATPEAAEQLAFMRRYPFANLVTGGGRPQVTHLPFLIEEQEGRIVLRAHMHRMNPQWKNLEEGEALVVFTGPHAYVSPMLYQEATRVPTWNYLALHAYGKARLLPSKEQGIDMLEATIRQFEPSYWDTWKALPPEWVNRIVPQLMAFEIEVTEILFQKKLSQDKPEGDRLRVMEYFLQTHPELGEYMRQL